MGSAQAYNTGLEHATGQYIAIMDHDDIACPDRLEQAVEFLETHPDIDGCGAAHAILPSFAFFRPVVKAMRQKECVYHAPDSVAAATMFGGMLFNPTVCFRRSVLDRVSPWYDPKLQSGADDNFLSVLLLLARGFRCFLTLLFCIAGGLTIIPEITRRVLRMEGRAFPGRP